MDKQQITRVPLKYWPILNTLSNEIVWKIFKNILWWNETLDNIESMYFDLMMVDIQAINKRAGDWIKWKEYWLEWKDYWKLWWRPKGGKEITPKGGLNNPPRLDKTSINKETIKEKKDVVELLSKEEIDIYTNELQIIWKMIENWYLVIKKTKELTGLINWVRDMAKDYLPRKEDWTLNWNIWKVYTNQREEYFKTLPKSKKNYKNSLRTSFSLYSKPKWK